ncbi:hypothetical protein B4U80_07850 [Leptotrombidium deliense]|uniref:Peptidase S54 rhomboid domain-containing protein n=1 Tax=Leptotrombidium deliense TaxID=299467 RepID=A0A443SW37_9ACAR|nr:hypothetical protein B4U80_07850 [Leptotrombidium deliense]
MCCNVDKCILLIKCPQNREKCGTDTAISVEKVLFEHEFYRLIFGGLEHADEWHLYFNMASFLSKGSFLETIFGSFKFFVTIMLFIPLVSAVIVAFYFLTALIMCDSSYLNICGVGFSGVIFSLKVLTTHYWQKPYRMFGVELISRSTVWIELVLISLITPDSSFLGHFAGITVGLFYIYSPLESIVDGLCTMAGASISKCGERINQALLASSAKKQENTKNVCNSCPNRCSQLRHNYCD